MNVIDQVMLPLLYQRIPENKRKKLAIEALEKV
jgi:ABC-type lipoprotein export system ATPase subunit